MTAFGGRTGVIEVYFRVTPLTPVLYTRNKICSIVLNIYLLFYVYIYIYNRCACPIW